MKKPEEETQIVDMMRVVFMPSDENTSVTFFHGSNVAMVKWESPISHNVFYWNVRIITKDNNDNNNNDNKDIPEGHTRFKIYRGDSTCDRIVIVVTHEMVTNKWLIDLRLLTPDYTRPTCDPNIADLTPLLKSGSKTKVVNVSIRRSNHVSHPLLGMFTGSPGIYHSFLGDHGYTEHHLELARHFITLSHNNRRRVPRQSPRYTAKAQLQEMKERLAELRSAALTPSTRLVLTDLLNANNHVNMSKIIDAYTVRHSANRTLVVSNKSPTVVRV